MKWKKRLVKVTKIMCKRFNFPVKCVSVAIHELRFMANEGISLMKLLFFVC